MDHAKVDFEPIVLIGNYGWQDVLNAHRLHEGIVELFFLPPIMLLFVVPSLLRGAGEQGDTGIYNLLITAGAITILSFALIGFFQFFLLPYQIRRNFLGEGEAQQRFELIFDHEGVEFVKEFAHIKQSWDLITHFRQNDELLLLYPKDRGYLTIPKRVLPNGGLGELQHLLEAHVAESRNPFGHVNYRILLLAGLVVLLVLFQLF